MQVNLVTDQIKSMDFPEIPSGEYLVMIQSIEQDIDKDAQAPYPKVTFQILEGQFANQKLFDRWKGILPQTETVFGKNTQYSLSRVKSLLAALGMANCNDLTLLVNQQVRAKVRLKDGFSNIQSFSPAVAQPLTNSQQQRQQPVTNSAPAGVNAPNQQQNQQPAAGAGW